MQAIQHLIGQRRQGFVGGFVDGLQGNRYAVVEYLIDIEPVTETGIPFGLGQVLLQQGRQFGPRQAGVFQKRVAVLQGGRWRFGYPQAVQDLQVGVFGDRGGHQRGPVGGQADFGATDQITMAVDRIVEGAINLEQIRLQVGQIAQRLFPGQFQRQGPGIGSGNQIDTIRMGAQYPIDNLQKGHGIQGVGAGQFDLLQVRTALIQPESHGNGFRIRPVQVLIHVPQQFDEIGGRAQDRLTVRHFVVVQAAEQILVIGDLRQVTGHFHREVAGARLAEMRRPQQVVHRRPQVQGARLDAARAAVQLPRRIGW